MRSVPLTVKEVRALALRLADEGGYFILECWEDEEIQAEIDEGAEDDYDWIKIFVGLKQYVREFGW